MAILDLIEIMVAGLIKMKGRTKVSFLALILSLAINIDSGYEHVCESVLDRY